MNVRLILATAVTAVSAVAIAGLAALGGGTPATAAASDPYEVWYLDQTDSRPGYGGLLHIHGGPSLAGGNAAGAQAETIDLGGAVSDFCREKTGANPVRPHMLAFNGGDVLGVDKGRFAVISWVASGHVSIHDAKTREILECFRTRPGSGGARQAHAAWPTSDQRYLVVANQNGKLVHRIRTDWANRRFEFEDVATLNLFQGNTPNGVPLQAAGIRPDNAPICIRPVYYRGQFSFVSLRGGGAFVIDHTATPMKIVAEWDKANVDDNGCGQVESRGKFFFNAGATGQASDRDGHTVYAVTLEDLRAGGLPPNTPKPRVAYQRKGEVDAHGFALARGGKHVLAVDRQTNDVTVLDAETEKPVDRISLAGPLSSDPAPDLLSPSPDGEFVFATLRGPTPLSGGHPATGNTPGLGVIRLDTKGGTGGRFVALAPARRTDQRAPDPHGIGVRVNRPPTLPGGLGVTPTVPREQRLATLRARGLTARFITDKGATVRATLRVTVGTAKRLKLPTTLGVTTRQVVRADDIAVVIRLSPRARKALEGRRARFNAQVTYTATSADGSKSTGSLPVRLKG